MRLWSLHPQYLDRTGLIALWREALLAQAVLLGKTRGYKHHPQLIRFRSHPEPGRAIAAYLREILREATKRGYRFVETKIVSCYADHPVQPIAVTDGQLLYERWHLLKKLIVRDPAAFRMLTAAERPLTHPLFDVCAGGVEVWEKIKSD
jgi:hypothetical protein